MIARLRAALRFPAYSIATFILLVLAYAGPQRADEEAAQEVAEMLRPAPDTKFKTEKEM